MGLRPLLGTVAALLLVGCGSDDSGGTSPDIASAAAVIDGPSTVELACDGAALASFSANSSTASEPITGYQWFLNNEPLGIGVNEEIRFLGVGTALVGLEIVGASGVLDRTTFSVQLVSGSAEACQDFGFIWGDPGHMWDGAVSAEYEFRLAGDLEVVWSLSRDGGEPVGLGPGLRRTVDFPGPGVYTLSATTQIAGVDRTYTAQVVVRDGEPISGPGLAGVTTTVKEDESLGCPGDNCTRRFHLLDLQTGGLTPPLYSTKSRFGGELCLPGDRMVARIDDVRETGIRPDLWIIDRFGRRIEQITTSRGLEQDPDVSRQGQIIFVNDSRTNFAYDEPMIYDPAAKSVRYIYPQTNTEERGFNPSFDTLGDKFGLGASPVVVENEVTRRIKIIDVGTGAVRSMHERPFSEMYPGLDVVTEGNGLIWTQDGDFIYTLVVQNPSGMQTWRANADGSDARRLSEFGDLDMFLTDSGEQLVLSTIGFAGPENNGISVMDLETGAFQTYTGPDGEPLLAGLAKRTCSSDLGW
jgi:hypothetical protein